MIPIIRRNVLVFLRDRTSVFFSLLAILIIFALYILFLGENYQSGLLDGLDGAQYLMDTWLVGGILAAASITTTMGAFSIMVEDKSKQIFKDFSSSPIRTSKLTAGYLFGAFIVGLFMTLLALFVGELFIIFNGGEWLSLLDTVKVIGLIILSVITNTAFVYFPVSFMQSENAFGTMSSVIGTLTGFLAGIYLPIGILPPVIQTVVKLFPVSHSASLLRQTMTRDAVDKVFQEAPMEAREGFEKFMGIRFEWNGTEISPWLSFLYLSVMAIVFYLLSIWSFKRKK
ncbi:ABC transporter permease [Jeotgalibaca sp. A127]|uniref:ABC transporter permease n=1 Tax=Jeotgalibaca sp. A127 TaxID=3457324 RepID=UPI003FD3E7B1